jgi:hypothetical protein
MYSMLDSEFEKRLDNIRENDHFPKLQNAHFANKLNKHSNTDHGRKRELKKIGVMRTWQD